MKNLPPVVRILLIEDDDIDVRVFERGFRKNGVDNPIIRARDGQEALDILRGINGQAAPPQWPFVILLDINMPRMNGLEFLEEIRNDPILFASTIFVLTTSEDEKDRVAAYSKHVAGYLVKSDAADQFVKIVRMIGEFITTVRFTENPPVAKDVLAAGG